jgi:ATP-binding cassette subfamily B protein
MNFYFYPQLDSRDCGPTCLRMVSKHYGKVYSLQSLREKSFITRGGVSLLGISEAAEGIGFRTTSVRISWSQFAKEVPLPCIVHWKQNHFVVVYDIKEKSPFFSSKKRYDDNIVIVADPAHGLVKYKKEEFLAGWLSNKRDGEEYGIALMLEPRPDFYNIDNEKPDKTKFSFLWHYLIPHKSFFIQVILAMLLGSLLQLIAPFSYSICC